MHHLSAGGWEFEPPAKFSKRGEVNMVLIFRGGCWERGGDFFQGGGGCSFYIKNKLKAEIFKDKRSLSTKMLTKNLNWKISFSKTKNLVTFKRWNGVKDGKLKHYQGSLKNLIFIEGERGVMKNQYIGGNC